MRPTAPVKHTRLNLKTWEKLPGPVVLTQKAHDIIGDAACEIGAAVKLTRLNLKLESGNEDIDCNLFVRNVLVYPGNIHAQYPIFN